MPAARGVMAMIETYAAKNVQANPARADVRLGAMSNRNTVEVTLVPEGRRTFVALLSASVISLVVWGLVVVLNVR
jgi:hypothetical protein